MTKAMLYIWLPKSGLRHFQQKTCQAITSVTPGTTATRLKSWIYVLQSIHCSCQQGKGILDADFCSAVFCSTDSVHRHSPDVLKKLKFLPTPKKTSTQRSLPHHFLNSTLCGQAELSFDKLCAHRILQTIILQHYTNDKVSRQCQLS